MEELVNRILDFVLFRIIKIVLIGEVQKIKMKMSGL